MDVRIPIVSCKLAPNLPVDDTVLNMLKYGYDDLILKTAFRGHLYLRGPIEVLDAYPKEELPLPVEIITTYCDDGVEKYTLVGVRADVEPLAEPPNYYIETTQRAWKMAAVKHEGDMNAISR